MNLEKINQNNRNREENISQPKTMNRRKALRLMVGMFGGGIAVNEAAKKVSVSEIKSIIDFYRNKIEEDEVSDSLNQNTETLEKEESAEDILERKYSEVLLTLSSEIPGKEIEPDLVERKEKRSAFEYKKPDMIPEYVEDVSEPETSEVVSMSKLGKFGRAEWSDRYTQAFRFQHMTMAVERRYNLPHNIILAMMIQEASGEEFLPNAIGDGGFGLSHMQPAIADEFGLRTFKKCKAMVCNGEDHRSCKNAEGEKQDHAGELEEEIRKYPDDREYLSRIDHRLNHLANIDAVGRILSHHIAYYPKSKGAFKGDFKNLGPLRTAICRYSGTVNFQTYWDHITKHMALLSDGEFLNLIKGEFEKDNIGKTINGKKLDLSNYIEEWQKFYMNYGVYDYVQGDLYKKPADEKILSNYEDYLPVVTDNTRKKYIA